MKKIGDYQYPTAVSFQEALEIADKAVNRYGGIIPNHVAASVLGYTVVENKQGSLGGPIYKKFDEACMFGLFTRDRGGLRITDLGKDALDPIDTSKAAAAKARALRNIDILGKAFDHFQGVIPEDTALPAKIAEITGAHWTEVKQHTENLGKLFSSLFPIIRASNDFPTITIDQESLDRGGETSETKVETRLLSSINKETGKPLYGELRTKIGSVMITDESTIDLAISHLNVLLEQVKKEKTEKKQT